MIAGPKESREELRIISIGGDSPPEVVAFPGATWVMPRDWSPDGTRVLCEFGLVGGGRSAAVVGVADRTIGKLDLPQGSWVEHRFTEDGNGVLYSAPADGKSGAQDIFLFDLKSRAATPVVQHPAEDLLLGALPGTEWLLFASDRRGSLDLWAVRFRRGRVDGGPVLVKQGLGRIYPLGFTNDGRYYYATLSAASDVLLADFDPATGKVTGEARKLTTRWDGVSMDPSFSPDGASLAYVVKRGPNPLPVHTADSLVLQSLKDPKAAPTVVGFEDLGLTRVLDPCWSAEGKAVILGGYRAPGRDKALYRVEVPSLRKTLIYEPRDERRRISHECATDGPFVYVRAVTPVLSQTTDLPDAVIRIDDSGADPREIFRAPQGQRIVSDVAAVSPDGRMLSVLTSLDRNRRLLLVMSSDGGSLRQVLEFRQPTVRGMTHTWASDGRSIFYVDGPEKGISSIRRVRVDGEATEPEAAFQSNQAPRGLRFHPDGRLLAFTGFPGSPASSEVWMIENLREQLARLAAPPTRKAP